MNNPYVIQYLEALHRPDGSLICLPGAYQVFLPAVPPNTQIAYDILPGAGYYASIGYAASIDHNVVPNVFQMTIIQWGAQPYSGILTSDLIYWGFEYIAVVTTAQPYKANIVNLTPLNQYLSMTGYFLNVTTQQDYDVIKDALKKLGTADAVSLLERLVASQPNPPEGGR